MQFGRQILSDSSIILTVIIISRAFITSQAQATFQSSSGCQNFCPSFTPIAIYKRYSPGLMQPHYFPSVGLNISVPSDWNLSQTSQSINEVATYRSPLQSPQDRFQENLMIKEGSYLQNLTRTDFINSTLKGLKELDHFQLVDRVDNFTLNGISSNKFLYSYNQNRNPYMGLQVGMLLGPAYLTITYNTELGKYAEYLPAIEKILSSIKVDDKSLISRNQNQNSTPSTFEDKSSGIALKYPNNWTRANDHYLSSIFAIYAPLNGSLDSYFDNIRINVQSFTPGSQNNLTAADHLSGLENYFKSHLKNFKVLQKQNLSMSDTPVYSVTYSFKGNDGKDHKLQRVESTRDNRLYAITYDSIENSFDSYIPVLKNLLSSFKFTS